MNGLSAKLKAARCPRTAAVIAAGGSGTRFGADKLMQDLGGLPVLARTLLAFERSDLIGEIVLVTRRDALEEASALCADCGLKKLTRVVPGGDTRAASCYAGVLAVSEGTELIAIHDGARPLVTEKVISDAVWGAYRHGAAVPAVPVRDTVKRASGRFVADTPDRRSLFAVQTPQCFRREIVLAALADAVEHAPDVTDDCAAVERLGGGVYLTDGDEENIKITTPLDLALAALILERRGEV